MCLQTKIKKISLGPTLITKPADKHSFSQVYPIFARFVLFLQFTPALTSVNQYIA